MKEKIGGVHEQFGPVYHKEWENMAVGDIVGLEGQDGLYRIRSFMHAEGKAVVVQVDEENKDSGEVYKVNLKSLTKDIA